MRLANISIDVVLVMCEERMHIYLVEEFCALGLREDEIGKQNQTEECVEGEPGEDEVGPVVEEGEEGQDHPIHQPWRKLSGIGGAEGFVGGEDGKYDCYGRSTAPSCQQVLSGT